MADASTVSVLIQARDNASQALKNVEGNMKSLGASFERHRRGIGLAATAIGAAVTGIAVLSVKSSLDQQIGISQLDAALKNVNTSYAAQEATIEKVIAAQQNKTNFGDEEQRKALRELILVSGSYTDAMAALIPTIELAAGKNMDLSAAATLVARAISGEETALGRYGIQVEKGAGATAVLTAIMESFGGQAEAAADPTTQLKNRMGDLFQVLGDALLPIIEKLVPMIEGLVKKIIDWAEAHPNLARVLGIVVAALGAALLVIGPLILILPTLVAGIGLVSAAFAILSVSMGPITAIVMGATAAIAAGILIWKNWDRIIAVVKQGVALFVRGFVEYIKMFAKAASAIAGFIPGLGGLEDKINQGIDKLDEMSGTVDKWADNTEEKVRAHGNAMGEVEDQVMMAAQKTAEGTSDMSTSFNNAANNIDQSTGDIIRSNADVAVSMEEVARAAELGWGHVEDQVMMASGVVVQSLDDMIRAQEQWEDSQDRSLGRIRENLDETIIKWRESGLRMEDVVKAWAEETGQSVGDVIDHWDKIDLDLDDLKGVIQAFTDTTGRDIFDWSSDMASASGAVRETLRTTAGDVEFVAMGIHDTIAGIHRDASRSVPAPRVGGYTYAPSATAGPAGARAPRTSAQALAAASPTLQAAVAAGFGNINAYMASIGKQGGGWAGGMTLVGERGPELVNLPGGSYVNPHGSGGMGGVTNQFHFHGSVYGVEDLKEAVVEAVRDHAISGGFSGVFAEA